jgi:hypothetical protein
LKNLVAVQLGEATRTGKYDYVGKIVDANGQPVSGAVRIGKTVVWANQSGMFHLPAKHVRTLPLIVMPEEFMSPGQWVVVSTPSAIKPDSPVEIVVRSASV